MYGLGEITQTDPAKLVRELHATAIAINQAKARNDVDGTRALLAHFRDVAAQYKALGAQADAKEFGFADSIILSTGQWIEAALAALPEATAALPRAIGEGLIKAAIPFALLYAGFLFLTRKR